jgi:hypothetical protein
MHSCMNLYIVSIHVAVVSIYLWWTKVLKLEHEHRVVVSFFFVIAYIWDMIMGAGTLLTLAKKRGELKILWTRGEPKRPCPHIEHQLS